MAGFLIVNCWLLLVDDVLLTKSARGYPTKKLRHHEKTKLCPFHEGANATMKGKG